MEIIWNIQFIYKIQTLIDKLSFKIEIETVSRI